MRKELASVRGVEGRSALALQEVVGRHVVLGGATDGLMSLIDQRCTIYQDVGCDSRGPCINHGIQDFC